MECKANEFTRNASVPDTASKAIGKIIAFLRLAMTETLAKRIVSIILLVAGVPNLRVTELTGLCDRSVRDLRKALDGGNLDDDLLLPGGGGRKSRLDGIKDAIIRKIDANDYHTQQEIADMVLEDHGVKIHRTGISRFLKKTSSGG